MPVCPDPVGIIRFPFVSFPSLFSVSLVNSVRMAFRAFRVAGYPACCWTCSHRHQQSWQLASSMGSSWRPLSTSSVLRGAQKTMNALVYTGPNRLEMQYREMPTIQAPSDAIVKMMHSTICGIYDLHPRVFGYY